MKNTVELLGYYGSDEIHACSAWTSTNREVTDSKRERIPALLNMLASAGHETPFEKSTLHFLVDTDIATHIHLLKHRIGVAINGECLSGDTNVRFTDDTLSRNIHELYHEWITGGLSTIKNQKIIVLDTSTGKFKNSTIKDIWFKGIQQLYAITLENGLIIKCTSNHRIYTDEEYNTINNGLTIGDNVGYHNHSFISKLNHKLFKKNRVQYSKIVSIELLDEQNTYDIEVEGYNKNFVANGIIVHNSARYKEIKEDKFLLPKDWNDIKVGELNQIRGLVDINIYRNWSNVSWNDVLHSYTELGNMLYHKSIEDLTPILGRKRAKESARYFKTYNSQIQADISFNFRSFVHFLRLRNAEGAQLEVRELAQEMLNLVKNIEGNPFEHTLKAFNL